MTNLKELHQQYVMPTYAPGLTLVRGEGAVVWDDAGREYLDFSSGIAVCGTGHCHPAVVAAIREQAGKLIHCSNLFHNELQPRLAQKISALGLGGKVFFGNSGAEANEALFKLARKWGSATGRYEIITMKNSFHGRTLATMTATGQTKYQKGFEPLMPGFVYADFNQLDSVRAAITPRTVAVLCESVQGEGGIIPATQEFMTGLRELCTEKNVLLFFDEVQTGIGRTGKWLGFQNYGIRADGFSLAKGLGSGYPIGAAAVTPELSDVFQPGNHASTFGGTPLACAAALATLETIEKENLMANAVAMGARLTDGLKKLAARHDCIQGVRGLGLMIGLALHVPAKPVEAKLREQGVLTIATGESVLRFVPPLVISAPQIDQALAILDKVL
ncbi:MAG: aspartate aminotransferase family protein [Kiritimatiellia bacterium]|jgi:acetylornithine/N-succinyldiaminopimelate aminotransferase|nr:aspartate aminotransferase family protein [Lentisphaerota bacterium]